MLVGLANTEKMNFMYFITKTTVGIVQSVAKRVEQLSF